REGVAISRSFQFDAIRKPSVKAPGADCSLQAKEPALAENPELIDVISEATRQHRRRAMPIDIDPLPGKGGPAKERSRMAHTPP
ncbi:hypothetical protein ABTA68_19975, partial [Acinetobacter baumannii]